jgi:ferredoxin
MRIVINPIACHAHGQCAELLPERVTLDEWGYPMIDDTEIPAALEPLARRAVRACPTLALRLRAAEVRQGRAR